MLVISLSAATQASTVAPVGAAAGATITWAKNGEVTGLDPQVDGAQTSWDVLYRTYERLLQVRDDGTLGPLLATSWKKTSSTAYVFRLRRDARFSNGRLMTSADVVTSFRRLLDPKLGSYALSQLGVIKSVVPEGRFAVRFKLSKASGTFLTGLAGIGASILPGKELRTGSFDPKNEILGTGPYKVAQHLQDQSWTLVRNPHYWAKDQPRVPKLVMLIMNDPAARLAALRSGRADIANFDSPDTPRLLRGTRNVRVVGQSTSDFYTLDLNTVGASSKVRDQRVRRAISMAIDRAQVISLALGRGSRIVAGAGTVVGLPDACDTKAFATPRPSQARALLSAAGATGLEFTIEANTAFPIFSTIAQVIQAQLRQIGLNPTIHSIENGAWLEKIYSKGDFDANVTYYTTFGDNWFGLANWSPETVLFTKPFVTDNAEYNRLLNQSAALGAGRQRAQLFQRMCALAANDANIIPVGTRTAYVAYRTDRVGALVQQFEPRGNTLKHVAEFARK